MFERVKRCGEPGLRQPRGDYAGLRRAPDLEGFGQGAEVRNHACSHRGGDGHRRRCAVAVEATQFRTGRSGGDRATHARRMPALAMERSRLARRELGPHFVAGDIGGEHLGAACAGSFALREDRRNEHGARMPVETDVVVVEDVRGDAVDQGGSFDTAPRARRYERGERHAGAVTHFAIDEGNRRIARARDENAEAVGDPSLRDTAAFRWNAAQAEIGDKGAEILSKGADCPVH